jgi:hypothetical protein
MPIPMLMTIKARKSILSIWSLLFKLLLTGLRRELLFVSSFEGFSSADDPT